MNAGNIIGLTFCAFALASVVAGLIAEWRLK